MTPHQIALIRDSFDKVVPIQATAAELFYNRLFTIAPEVRPLFKGDMAEQGRKLMAALALITRSLDDLDTLLPTAARLAERHVGYGVQPEHYPPVGEALLWTLETGLEDAFTPEVKRAWAEAYGTLSAVMIAAAYPMAAADPEAASAG